jgi:hypothetical protein
MNLAARPQPDAVVLGEAPAARQNPKEFWVKSVETVAFVFNYCQEFSFLLNIANLLADIAFNFIGLHRHRRSGCRAPQMKLAQGRAHGIGTRGFCGAALGAGR